MDLVKNKKSGKGSVRKSVFGIKLPPIELDIDDNVKTILDVDPDYYTLVDGRPIRPNTSINNYKKNVKEVAFKRTLHGYLTDEILRIQREIETERDIYETARKHFDEYQNSFDKFLAHDNNKTITIMKNSDALAKELAAQTEEHKKANYEMASLKSKLQYIDETLLILLSFEKFLHKAAPILWQESHNIKLNSKVSEIFTINSDIYQKIDIDLIKEKLSKLNPPTLYFESPEQLFDVFGQLEKQNLNYLLITEEFIAQKYKFLKALELLKFLMRKELDYVQQKIKEIEEIILLNKNREQEVKYMFYNILEEKMRHLISSETVLQIYNYVEYTYEQTIAPNDTNLSSLDLTLALEREYDDLILDLSAYDLDLIKEIEKESYGNDAQQMKQAKIASKLLKDVDKLTKRLKSSFEPSRSLIE